MPYRYSEPTGPEFQVLPAGEYDFVVVDVQDTYEKNGNFILPIKIQIKDYNVIVFDYPSAGRSKRDNKPYDTIAPFLKAIRRNPAVDEEPDFSAKNLVGAKGRVKLKIEQYQGVNNNKVHYYVYDRDQANATVSQGAKAQAKTYNQPPLSTAAPATPDEDDIPF